MAQDNGRYYDFRIEARDLGGALGAFVKQTDKIVLYPYELADAMGMNPVIGRYTVDEAFEIMFRDTVFTGSLAESGVLTISQLDNKDRENDMSKRGSKGSLFAGVVAFFFGATGVTETYAAVDELVVTTRKRAESLQDVPLSIVGFGREVIDLKKISNLDDLARFTPGFTMDAGLGLIDARPAIRGQSNIRAASQPTVGVLIDGIDLPFRSGLNGETLDIERIEVVKGPQSALYGRGVLSGAINYVTQRPDLDRVGGYVEGEVATDDLYEVRGRINIPLSPEFAVAVSARYSEFDSSFVNNKTGANTIGGHEFNTIVGSALWEPNETFNAYLRVEKSDESREAPPRHTVASNTQTGDLSNQVWFVGEVDANEDLISCDCDEYSPLERDFTRATLDLEWDVGFGTINSLTGFSQTDLFFDQDNDFESVLVNGGPPFFGNWRAIIDRSIETVSQEIRFTSPDEDRFRWLLGGYYYQQENDESGQNRFGLIPEPVVEPFVFQSDETKTYAIFGQASFDATEQLTLSAEVRWNRDELSSEGIREGEPFPLEETFDNWLPRFTLEFQATDDVLLYASAAKGSKPGGFNRALGAGATGLLPLELIAFDEEQAWSYEVGVKSSWLDDRLIANAAVFYVDWTDIQVDDAFTTSTGGSVGFTSNAGQAEVMGFEFSIEAKPSNNVDLSLGYSYNPAEVIDASDRRAARAGIDTSGRRNLPYTAEHSATGSIRLHGGLENGWDWFALLDGRYDSTQYATIANLAETGDRFTSNLRLGLDNDSWSIQAYATNLFDSDDPASIAPFINLSTFERQFLVTVPNPRQIGIKVRRNF